MAMSNNQRGTVGLSAGDWVRLQRIRGSKLYRNYNLATNQDIESNSRVGIGRIRRPASMWSDYIASQSVDVVTNASTGLNGNVLTTTKICGCGTQHRVISVGTDISSCQNTRDYKLYTFTPLVTGTYTISAIGTDPDLFISYPDAHLDAGSIAATDNGGPTALYSNTDTNNSIITATFEGFHTYEVMVLQWGGTCFQLTVTD
jgi:hypothetical protein